MFIHNIDPVALSIGNFKIYYYGIIYAFGFLLAYLMIPWIAKKRGIKKLTKDKTADLILWLVVGDIIGARLFHVLFYNPLYYLNNLLEIFQIWKGGLSFHGALVGIMIAVWLFCKRNKIDFYDVADTAAIPAALALFLGRIANFINAELVGKITNINWCVVFPGHEGCRHPVQLYESLKNLVIFGVLLFVSGKTKKKGVTFWTFVMSYGVLRFFLEFYKDYDFIGGPSLLGLNAGQLLCIPMIIIAGIFLFKINKK